MYISDMADSLYQTQNKVCILHADPKYNWYYNFI